MISIIIPTYNHLDDCLKPCLTSVAKYTDLTQAIEVVVVGNGCTDGTKKYVKKMGMRFLDFPDPLGYPKAVNEGVKAAKGDYLVMLNNDTILLEQPRNQWLQMLLEPFKRDHKMGVTGPILGPSAPADRNFIVFFCACFTRKVWDECGPLDPIYGVGGGEDTEFCIKAENMGYKIEQVPSGTRYNGELLTGEFPIYHKGEATVNDNPKWKAIFDRNSTILTERWNQKWKLSNRFERAVIGRDDYVPPREDARYKWAAKHAVGKRVLEIGCSSGYGTRYLHGKDYTGIDYDKAIVEYAREQFPAHKFEHADINTYALGQYDTIIAYEVLEHVDNGRELAQRLKNHCRCLLATVPYNEKPGQWGPHHKLHALTPKDFPGFKTAYVTVDGRIADKPEGDLSLILLRWQASVTAVVCTRNRYDSTLPMCLSAIANQTYKPMEIILYDDGEHRDLRQVPQYNNLFAMIDKMGIKWRVGFTDGGQVVGHRKAITEAKGEFIWRVDDDCVPEPDCLNELMSSMTRGIGAVGGLVLDPKMERKTSDMASNRMEDIYLGLNQQWFRGGTLPYHVEHLYSSFLYRKQAARPSFYVELSRVGHREETIFSHLMLRAGWGLLVHPTAVTWHLRQPSGGIRVGVPEMWARDERKFQELLDEWGVKPKRYKVIVLDSGIGDHYVFKKVLPEVQKKYPHLVLAVCYPTVFHDCDVKLCSIAESKGMGITEGVYKMMSEHGWKGSLEEAYRRMYL